MHSSAPRLTLITVVLAASVSCSGVPAPPPESPPPAAVMAESVGAMAVTQAPALVPVTITARCLTQDPWYRIDVRPSTAHVRKGGDRVRFNAPDEPVTVSAKKSTDWPFATTSFVVPRGGEVLSDTVRTDARLDHRYPYNITITCGGVPRTMDPDIIVTA